MQPSQPEQTPAVNPFLGTGLSLGGPWSLNQTTRHGKKSQARPAINQAKPQSQLPSIQQVPQSVVLADATPVLASGVPADVTPVQVSGVPADVTSVQASPRVHSA
ncbi:hypothetical protein ABVT39_019995, partial [Epinephelus coioides]